MPQKRLATLTLTSAYQRASTLVSDISGAFSNRILTSGAFKVPSSASNPVRVSITLPAATTGSDSLSNLFAAGEELPFTEVNLEYVWLKGSGGASTVEIEGDDPS